MVGGLSGFQAPVSLGTLIQKTLRVHGLYVGSVELFERFARAVDATKIAPVVDQTYSFQDAGKAYARIASGEHFGKIVIQVGKDNTAP